MNESLANRVRAAAVAGWWTILIAAVFMHLQWWGFLAILNAKPEWLLSLWGGGELDWPTVHTIVLYFFSAFKLMLLMVLVVVIWLTLWSKRLKRDV